MVSANNEHVSSSKSAANFEADLHCNIWEQTEAHRLLVSARLSFALNLTFAHTTRCVTVSDINENSYTTTYLGLAVFFSVEQDINQDGYGDIIVGAPGVGSNAGSAYVVFGREVFSASYTLGSIGPEGSFVLIAPTDNGYGGFSVGGTGEPPYLKS